MLLYKDRELEFWIREIDHLAGHHLGNFDSAHNNPKYQDIHYELREELEKKLKDGKGKDSFYQKLTEMYKKLMFCKCFEEIENVVNKTIPGYSPAYPSFVSISNWSSNFSTCLRLDGSDQIRDFLNLVVAAVKRSL